MWTDGRMDGWINGWMDGVQFANQAHLIELLLVGKHGPDLLPLVLNVFLEGAELLLHDAVLPLEPQPQLLLKVELAPIPGCHPQTSK